MKLVLIFVIALSAAAQDGEKLIQANDCSSCHAVDRQVVGPAYSAVAKRYAGQADARSPSWPRKSETAATA